MSHSYQAESHCLKSHRHMSILSHIKQRNCPFFQCLLEKLNPLFLFFNIYTNGRGHENTKMS